MSDVRLGWGAVMGSRRGSGALPRAAPPAGLVAWRRVAVRRRRAVMQLICALELCHDLGVDLPAELASLAADVCRLVPDGEASA